LAPEAAFKDRRAYIGAIPVVQDSISPPRTNIFEQPPCTFADHELTPEKRFGT